MKILFIAKHLCGLVKSLASLTVSESRCSSRGQRSNAKMFIYDEVLDRFPLSVLDPYTIPPAKITMESGESHIRSWGSHISH